MLVDEAIIGIDPDIATSIAANLPAEAVIENAQPEMLVVHLQDGDKAETLQLGRLVRSLYQQLKDEKVDAGAYFGVVTFERSEREFDQAMQLAKRIASDCLQEGNRRISCVEYTK